MTKRTLGSTRAAASTTKHLAALMGLAMLLSACDGAASSPTSASATAPSTPPAPFVTSLSLNVLRRIDEPSILAARASDPRCVLRC